MAAEEQLLVAKGVLLGVVGIATFIASLTPWLVNRCFTRTVSLDIIAIGSAASAGIVLGSFMSHMLPDATESFNEYFLESHGEDSALANYPLAPLLAGAVLIILISVDRLVVSKGMAGEADEHGHDHVSQSLQQLAEDAKRREAEAAGARAANAHGRPAPAHGHSHGHVHSRHAHPPTGVDSASSTTSTATAGASAHRSYGSTGALPHTQSNGGAAAASKEGSVRPPVVLELAHEDRPDGRMHPADHLGDGNTSGAASIDNVDTVPNSANRSRASTVDSATPLSSAPAVPAGVGHQLLSRRAVTARNDVDAAVMDAPASAAASAVAREGDSAIVGGGHHSDGHDAHGPSASQRLKAHQREAVSRAYIFVAALSVHSFFDGLGLGGEDNLSGFESVLVAVLSHKLLDGFAVGTPVYFSGMSWFRSAALLALCAVMTPLGIAVGMGAAAAVEGPTGKLVDGIVISLASGSFIFISLMELLPAALHDARHTHLKLATFALGWAAMAVLAAFV